MLFRSILTISAGGGMVDTLALGASAFGCEGSSPSLGTKILIFEVMSIESFEPILYETLLVKCIENTITVEESKTLILLISLSLKTIEAVALSKEIEHRVINNKQ